MEVAVGAGAGAGGAGVADEDGEEGGTRKLQEGVAVIWGVRVAITRNGVNSKS